MAEDLGERTEEPTGRRLSEARERGQVARSTDLSGAILLSGVVLLLLFLTPSMFSSMASLMRYHLAEDTLGGVTPHRLGPDIVITAMETVRVVAPVMLILALVAFLGSVFQVGLHLSTRALEPKWSNLNLAKGLGKIFSKRSAVKGGLDLAKLALIATVAGIVITFDARQVAMLPFLTAEQGIVLAVELCRDLALWILAVLILLGLIDFRYQKWQHRQDLRMTKHEVKDEMRSTEGDTETKARRLKMARQIAMQRLAHDVPKADVIVTNPTHYAVALRYDPAKGMPAPRVVAKGADYLALKIRYIAAAHGVPIIERPPLARALYKEVPVGREINPAHYEAVAEVLAYVYRLEGRLAS